MRHPVVLALFAVLAAVALYLLLIRDNADGAKTGDSSATDPVARPARQDAPQRASGPARQPGRRGDAPAIEGTSRQDEPGRDHRTDPEGDFIRPALPHRSASPVDGRVTAAVMREVRPVVTQCMSQVPDIAYGDQAVVMTSAVISIDDEGNLTVEELGPALRDIDEVAAASALECIRAAASTVHAHVDHPAVDATTVAVTIRPHANRP